MLDQLVERGLAVLAVLHVNVDDDDA